MIKRFKEFLREASDFHYFTGKNVAKGFLNQAPVQRTRAYDSDAYKDTTVNFTTNRVKSVKKEKDESPKLDINLSDDILALQSYQNFSDSKRFNQIADLIKEKQYAKSFACIKELSIEAKLIFERINSINLSKISTAFFESEPKEKQDLIKEELLNWSPEKGDPYEYEIGNKEERNPLPDVTVEIVDKKPEYGKSIIKLDLNHNMKTIEQMPEEYYIVLQAGSKKDSLVSYLHDLKEDIDSFEVYFDYPFEKVVKAVIPAKYKAFDSTKEVNTENSIGYYIKQISDAYGKVYKDLAEKVWIWGHGFGDLYLERIEFTDDNKIKLSIGS